MDNLPDTTVTSHSTTTPYHNVPTDELSQMMTFVAIALAASLFAWAVSKVVTALHNRVLKRKEKEGNEELEKETNEDELGVGGTEATVFVNDVNFKCGGDDASSSLSPLGIFGAVLSATAKNEKEKKATQKENGEICEERFQTPVEKFTPEKSPSPSERTSFFEVAVDVMVKAEEERKLREKEREEGSRPTTSQRFETPVELFIPSSQAPSEKIPVIQVNDKTSYNSTTLT